MFTLSLPYLSPSYLAVVSTGAVTDGVTFLLPQKLIFSSYRHQK